MTNVERRKFKGLLEAKEALVSGSLCNRGEIVIQQTPDAIDAVQMAGEREFAIRNLDRDSSMLRQIRGALARIEDGTYGVCQRCEEDISPKRIHALPWARLCIECQEEMDRRKTPAYDAADPITA